MTNNSFSDIFNKLKKILSEYEKEVVVKKESSDTYYLNTGINPLKPNEEVFLGMVQIKKNYVSFHLFPVYVYPELVTDVSVELKKKMQGKSCFNFKKTEETLFKELKQSNNGFKKCKENNYV